MLVVPVGVAVGVRRRAGVGVRVGVGVGVGGVGVGPLPGATVMPLTLGFWVPATNRSRPGHELLAVVVNVRAMALFRPPAEA